MMLHCRVLMFLLATALVRGADDADYPLSGPQQVVLRLAVADLGGKPRPQVEVLGDGRVRERGNVLATKLTARELQDLLRFAIKKHRFFEHDGKALKRTLADRERGGGFCGTGFTTTHIHVAVRGKKRKLDMAMLSTRVSMHPGLPALADLLAIQRRLLLEARLANAGGRQKVLTYLKAANARLKQRFPKRKPLTIGDFQRVTKLPIPAKMFLPQGADPHAVKISGACAIFRRTRPPKSVTATVKTDPKAKPRTAVNAQG